MPRKKSEPRARKPSHPTDTERLEILAYVERINGEVGDRSDSNPASREFSASQLAIGNWIHKAEDPAAPQEPRDWSLTTDLLGYMMELTLDLEALQERLEQKRAQFDELKRQL